MFHGRRYRAEDLQSGQAACSYPLEPSVNMMQREFVVAAASFCVQDFGMRPSRRLTSCSLMDSRNGRQWAWSRPVWCRVSKWLAIQLVENPTRRSRNSIVDLIVQLQHAAAKLLGDDTGKDTPRFRRSETDVRVQFRKATARAITGQSEVALEVRAKRGPVAGLRQGGQAVAGCSVIRRSSPSTSMRPAGSLMRSRPSAHKASERNGSRIAGQVCIAGRLPRIWPPHCG